jgi:hypothetical protein
LPEDENGAFVRVTNTHIYQELLNLKTEVQSIRHGLRNVQTALGDVSIRSLAHDQTKLEKRVRSLELKFYGIISGLVAGLFIVAKGTGLL